MPGQAIYDRTDKKLHLNIAKLSKGGEDFEVDIDPDLAMDFKNGKAVDIRDVLKAQKIFTNINKGMLVSEHIMIEVFKTDDVLKVAETILRQGEIQVSAEYRNKLRENKRKKIINLIHRNSIDPRTNAPHTLVRIEDAMKEAKVKVDEFKAAEDQVQGVMKKLTTILPMKTEKKTVKLIIPHQYAGKCSGIVRQYGAIKKETWGGKGDWIGMLEVPAGMVEELFDKLNSITHGNIDSEIVESKK